MGHQCSFRLVFAGKALSDDQAQMRDYGLTK